MPIVSLRRIAALPAAALLAFVQPAGAQDAPKASPVMSTDPVIGNYVSTQMELVAGLRLRPDGTFDYALTVGSLDERGQGRWNRTGQRIELVSDPRPVAPSIAPGAIETAAGEPFAIRLLAPNGADIPGIDLRIDFDTGAPLESYLAGGPWSLPPDERRQPRFVSFSKKSYRIQSARLPLQARAGTIATFVLTPNDFGVVDLTGAYLEPDGENLVLTREDGSIVFRRAED